MSPLDATVRVAFQSLGLTQEDFARGFADVQISINGEPVKIRMTAPPARFRWALLQRYASTADAALIVRPMLPKERATDEFLKMISPGDLASLSTVAVGLLLGPNVLREMINNGLADFKQAAPENPN